MIWSVGRLRGEVLFIMDEMESSYLMGLLQNKIEFSCLNSQTLQGIKYTFLFFHYTFGSRLYYFLMIIN